MIFSYIKVIKRKKSGELNLIEQLSTSLSDENCCGFNIRINENNMDKYLY